MITKLSTYLAPDTDPFLNLAVEEFLTFHFEAGECILYLWQNHRTVVVGRNQNPWKECNIPLLEADGGRLARRLSGGGAVYHDTGNLNFTFILSRQEADILRQLSVILSALASLGIQADQTGRNDIVMAGRKCSGNAFYQSGNAFFHHGTLLLNTDTEEMSKYLTVSAGKLQSKGVDSVRSRVGNLIEQAPWLTIQSLERALIQAFEKVYRLPSQPLPPNRLEKDKIEKIRKLRSSWQWRFGRPLSFTMELSHRFSWGSLELALQADSGRILDARLYSDAMEQAWFSQECSVLHGCPCQGAEISQRLCSCLAEQNVPGPVLEEIRIWLKEAI